MSTQIPINTTMLNGKAQRFHCGVGNVVATRMKLTLTLAPNTRLASTSDKV